MNIVMCLFDLREIPFAICVINKEVFLFETNGKKTVKEGREREVIKDPKNNKQQEDPVSTELFDDCF